MEKAYEQSPEIAAVILTSPTYEGIVSNIRQIADVVHAHGGVLIVDEAHGAHLPYANHGANQEETYLPYSAVREGADICHSEPSQNTSVSDTECSTSYMQRPRFR